MSPPSPLVANLRRRAQALTTVRAFFAERDVLEVTAPTLRPWTVTDVSLESLAAGDGFLQTSPEAYLKILLAHGAPSLYSLGPCFRADEIGRLHNPEFTMLEWYRLGFDDAQLMDEVEELCDALLGLGRYERHTYCDLIASVPEADVPLEIAQSERFDRALAKLPRGRHFVVDYPGDQAALARLRAGNANVAARFELIIDGIEIANGYWEEASAAVLAQRFESDRRVRAKEGLVVPEPDEAFLAAMAEGLPDCAGVALGFDRLLMLASDQSSIEEALPGWR